MYNTEIKKLLENLNDFQKLLIEDLDAEGLNIHDIEFDKMIDERSLSKKEKEKIYQFFKDRANLRVKYYFNELNEIERQTIEDLLQDNLYPGDNEFNQMLNERIVDKEKIYNYFNRKKEEFLYNYSKDEIDFINKMIKDGININDKEFNEIINNKNYDRDKVIKYYNNIDWINNTTNTISNINKKKEEMIKQENIKQNNDEIISENGDDKTVIENDDEQYEDEIMEEEDNKQNEDRPIVEEKKDKISNPYDGLNYYQRLSLYAKEKENLPSHLDNYDYELSSLREKQRLEKTKEKKSLLYQIKKHLKNQNNTNDKKLGFVDVILISSVIIVFCILFILIFKLFV